MILTKIITSQSAEGYWQDKAPFASSINPAFEAKLRGEVSKIAERNIEKVICTLLALWVLETEFEDTIGEWQMISAKAKAYLKSQGVTQISKIF